MIEFLVYDLKVAALLAVFYMFYRLMLAKETFHRVNRVVLLLTAVASFVLPLCVITMHHTVLMSAPQGRVDFGGLLVADMATELQMPWWQVAVIMVFLTGAVATLGHTFWSLCRIVSLVRKSEKHPQDDGVIICVTDNDALAPFSWMCFIVMNRHDFEEQNAAILLHERGHIRQHHSWDLLLVDTLTAFQWFNPAIWMLRSDLRAIHEYEADGAVLSQGINAREYQYLLIVKAANIGGYSLVNGINHSALKSRITMMLHPKSRPVRLFKLAALLPIVAVTLAVNAESVTDYVYAVPQQQVPVKKGRRAGVIKLGNQTIKVEPTQVATSEKKEADVQLSTVQEREVQTGRVFNVVERMPQYPGGPSRLFEFLSANIHYPADAENSNTQGRVVVSFVVEDDGSISNAHVVRSVAPSLDAEALRVVNSMPNWIPGSEDGKAVRVKYTLPVTFRLAPSSSKSATEHAVAYQVGREAAKAGLDSKGLPLVIVDDVEKPLGSLDDVDPKTIDHIDVLKDAQTLAKYGEKGKHGVILVTTKK